MLAPRGANRTGMRIPSTNVLPYSYNQFCKVAPACTVSRGEHLVDFAFFSKDGKHRIDHTTASRPGVQQLKLQGQAMHIDTLRKLIPTNIARWQT